MAEAAAILITVPLSHYCEKARWGLDRARLPYREEAHAPLFNRIATKRNEGGTVPVLIHGSRRFIDSTDILVHADGIGGGDLLYPRDGVARREVDQLEEKFDTELGPHVRRWAYSLLLPHTRIVRSLWSRGVPRFEANAIPILTPLVRYLARSGYRITPESTQRSLDQVQRIFRETGELLRDGRRFLAGGRFTAADVTFASLAAPMLLPAECRAVQPSLDELPAAMRNEILNMRDTDAGRFALGLFAQERLAVGGV
jgi:glutathione S-transferase